MNLLSPLRISGTLTAAAVQLLVASCLAGVALAGAPAASQPAAPAVAQIAVDAGADRGPVNRRVLGNNALAYLHAADVYARYGSGMWDGDRHCSNADMVRLARQAGVSTLRWPGGCGAHYYNWKLTVGPLKDRPKQPFGLPEFITLCKDIGADPVITLAAYWGGPGDAADIVEYLNAPVGRNPGGGTDWAKVRAADGHPEPIGAVWFEYGNETDHGGHRSYNSPIEDKLTPEQYARNYLAYRQAMRAVDPKVKLGAVLVNDLWPPPAAWTETVVRLTGKVADFYIHHAYLPQYARNDSKPPADELYRLAFAAPRQFDYFYTALNDFLRRVAGRDVPLAITEYNGHFVQDRPTPYRLCLGTAVEVADLLRVLMDPRHHIDNAQYWQFANEYWGMVKGLKPPYVLRPAWYVFRLYNEHLGDRLIGAEVRCGSYETGGSYGVRPASDKGGEFRWLGPQEPVPPKWRLAKTPDARMTVDADGVLCAEITTDKEFNFYHAQIDLPAQPDTGYRVSAQVRTEGLTRLGARIQMGDGRGWLATRSAAMSGEVASTDWQDVEVDYHTLKDTRSIQIVARRLENSPQKGRLWVRNVRIRPFQPHRLGAVPYLGVLASKGDKGVSVFIVNRRIDGPVAARITGPKAASAAAWTLTGPSVDATNERDPQTVRVVDSPVQADESSIRVSLPPHSFTAVVVRLR